MDPRLRQAGLQNIDGRNIVSELIGVHVFLFCCITVSYPADPHASADLMRIW